MFYVSSRTSYLKAYMSSYHLHSLYIIHYNKSNTIPDVRLRRIQNRRRFQAGGQTRSGGYHNYLTYSKYKTYIIMNVFNVTVVHSL